MLVISKFNDCQITIYIISSTDDSGPRGDKNGRCSCFLCEVCDFFMCVRIEFDPRVTLISELKVC